MKMISALAALVAFGFASACQGPAASSGEAEPPAEAEAASPAEATPPDAPARLNFTAALNGAGALVATPSTATGQAVVTLNPETETIDLEMTVTGITLDQLWDQLIPAPIGPVHFHLYASHDHSADSASLAVPVPYGPAFAETPEGFSVTLKDFPYAEAQAITGSTAPFADFATSLQQGLVLLNIHTDAFPDGEIGGTVAAAD